MTFQRWGAFSVIDHKDARALAADVLLYDRLVLPTPPDWDRARWIENAWDPEGLDRRLKQLGDLAIPAAWDLDRQKQWKEKFEALSADARDMSAALHQTRRVLAQHGRDYRPGGVGAVEVIAAYQSEAEFDSQEGQAGGVAAELDFLIAQRLAIPDEEDPEESLQRALGLCSNDAFLGRRKRFHEWQRSMLVHGVVPADAADELVQLVQECNEAVAKSGRSYRMDTVLLVGGLSAAAAAAFAGAVPGAVSAIGIGALTGVQVASLGNAAVGALIQVIRHVRARKAPDHAAGGLSGAMFHQIEKDLGWKLRAAPEMA